jgi:hypothetical protein
MTTVETTVDLRVKGEIPEASYLVQVIAVSA